MTVRLVVDGDAWRHHVHDVVASVPGLVPVVKGNGYGLGRTALAGIAAELADTIAVGTIHELAGLPATVDVAVLTPTLEAPDDRRPILTVGSPHHADVLRGWGGRVVVKLESSMHRYGGAPELAEHCRSAGLDVVGYSLHLPLPGTGAAHLDEVERWLPRLDPAVPLWLSHLSLHDYRRLPASHRYRLRLGTDLWHGRRDALHLSADVLDTRHVGAGTPAGYRHTVVPCDATLVMVGAGTANGVHPLADGRSPFHHARRRVALLEPPHMHTSMLVVPDGDPCPAVGDWIDVQRPLTTTVADRVVWT